MDLPSGTRNYDYATDMAVLRTKTHWVLFFGFLIVLFTAPLYLRDNMLSVLNLIGITVIAVTGLNILVGYCGQLSIGHAGFMAAGAYTSGILTSQLHWPFLIGLLCAGLSAGLIGIIFGLPSVRVKGFYLAITTIAAQFIIIWVINHWTNVTGGFNGMNVTKASMGGFVFRSQASQYFLIMAVLHSASFLPRTWPGVGSAAPLSPSGTTTWQRRSWASTCYITSCWRSSSVVFWPALPALCKANCMDS